MPSEANRLVVRDYVYCLNCGERFDADTIPYPLGNGLCRPCRREIKRPNHRLRIENERLRKTLADAAFLFGALGHGGEHEDCDPCAFVREWGPS